jgi:hypothetical protein
LRVLPLEEERLETMVIKGGKGALAGAFGGHGVAQGVGMFGVVHARHRHGVLLGSFLGIPLESLPRRII